MDVVWSHATPTKAMWLTGTTDSAGVEHHLLTQHCDFYCMHAFNNTCMNIHMIAVYSPRCLQLPDAPILPSLSPVSYTAALDFPSLADHVDCDSRVRLIPGWPASETLPHCRGPQYHQTLHGKLRWCTM